MTTFAFPLKTARIQSKLSQSQLAERVDMTQTSISHLEQGVHKPRESTKQKIEQVLGPIDWQRTFDESKIKRHILTN